MTETHFQVVNSSMSAGPPMRVPLPDLRGPRRARRTAIHRLIVDMDHADIEFVSDLRARAVLDEITPAARP